VVDDEAAVRDVLTDSLRAEGCDVLAAENGQVALALFDAHNGDFDAVFTDIGMPEMGGWEFANALRRRSDTVALAIVSGWADAISHDTRCAVKADWVVLKPFDINLISEIAGQLAERRRLASFPGSTN
jgi:CheY-like chemotaxis protein